MRVVVDASAMAAVMLGEDAGPAVEARLQGATLYAPDLLRFELANAAVKKARKHPRRAPQVFGRLADVFQRLDRVKWRNVNPADVALLAHVTGLSAYDATYLWLAGWLEADLVTLDKRLTAAIDPAADPAD